ncbi:MAG: methylmalonyl-CoA mutase family protein [Marmoricola sp.]
MADSVPFALDLPGVHADQSAWEKAAADVLRKTGRMSAEDPDALVWRKLTRTTLDGIAIAPVGSSRNAAPAGQRPERAGAWDVRAGFADFDPKVVAEQAIDELQNGTTSLLVQVGLGALAPADLSIALKDVLLDVAPVVLSGGGADEFCALLTQRGVQAAEGTNLGADPLGEALRGVAPTSDLGEVVSLARTHHTLAICIDGTAVHDQSGSDVQELGWVIAAGATYLRELEGMGLSATEAAGLIELRLAATDDQFPTIAKMRALRQLWSRVLELSHADAPTLVHAVTSRPMMSSFDPYVNMLRTCVAAFAAGVGGADAVTVLPFDAPIGLPDNFSRRIARNTSALLIDEAHVGKVADPAGGSFAVEQLTHDLAEAAWAFLAEIENAGGASAATPMVQERISEVAVKRDGLVANRKAAITGLTEFPNLGEALPSRRDYAEGGIEVRAYGHEFEALRRDPIAPPVFLATMGPIAAHTARATFATNLLAAGGIACEAAGASESVADLVNAASGHRVVCLCGTDKAYAEWGSDLVAALRAGGASRVIVAGKVDVGADDIAAMGINALDFLNRTREALS